MVLNIVYIRLIIFRPVGSLVDLFPFYILGEEYIEEVKSEAGKVVGFECKLCDCKFNDQIAREAHLTGRRHKLSYKVR